MSQQLPEGINSRATFLEAADRFNREFLADLKRGRRYVSIEDARREPQCTGRFAPDPDNPEHPHVPIYGRGEPEALFLAYEDAAGVLRFGWSARHPRRERRPFCRVEARYRAIRRSTMSLVAPAPPLRLSPRFRDFMIRSGMQLREVRNARTARAEAS